MECLAFSELIFCHLLYAFQCTPVPLSAHWLKSLMNSCCLRLFVQFSHVGGFCASFLDRCHTRDQPDAVCITNLFLSGSIAYSRSLFQFPQSGCNYLSLSAPVGIHCCQWDTSLSWCSRCLIYQSHCSVCDPLV